MKIFTIGFFSLFFLLVGWNKKEPNINQKGVQTILKKLGGEKSPNELVSMRKASAIYGEQLVHLGFTKNKNGVKGKQQSKHFVCTSCHNVVKEQADLSSPDPQAKLDYSVENNIPFLQGSTLYGAVNRNSFYNDDYFKKYGELTLEARNDIRKSIQLCAVECAQGRALEDWEIESILAYLWKIELKMEDLNLSAEELSQIKSSLKKEDDQEAAIASIKEKYLESSPATFLYPPENRKEGFTLKGDPTNGEKIYQTSCLHCHEKGRYSFFVLDESKYSFKYLQKHITRYSPYSIYQVSRYGTSPMNGKRSYMPFYTKEKMSDQMLEDLRAFIESK